MKKKVKVISAVLVLLTIGITSSMGQVIEDPDPEEKECKLSTNTCITIVYPAPIGEFNVPGTPIKKKEQ